MTERDDFDPLGLVGRTIDDRFQVVALLGAGGMGAVYRARQLSVDRSVALKVLTPRPGGDPISVERFRQEALLASRLHHPHAIMVHDFGQATEGLLYIAMELLQGESLRQRLRRGALGAREASKICAELLRTLAEAHRIGLVHRDIKPDNVFLAEVDGDLDYVKVLDFGIAKLVAFDPDAPAANLTQQGKVFGTAAYMSPEQIRGQAVDAQADLYAAGVVLYEMICGRPPFVSVEPREVLRMHLEDAPPPPSALYQGASLELERIALRALDKNLSARYTSAEEFLEAVEGYKYNSGFYAVPARLAAMASVTEPGRRPADAGEIDDDDLDASGIGATMMLEQHRPVGAGPSPFEDEDPPFAELPTPPPRPPPPPAMDLMDFSVEGDADERTMLEFGDEPEVSVLPTPAVAQAVVAVPPAATPALWARPVPAAPAAIPPRVLAPGPAGAPAVDGGYTDTLDALADGDDDEDSIVSSAGPVPPPVFALPSPEAPADEPTMLELEDDELEEVEPSRLVPIPKFDDEPSVPPAPRSTLFGGPGVVAPRAAPAPVVRSSASMPVSQPARPFGSARATPVAQPQPVVQAAIAPQPQRIVARQPPGQVASVVPIGGTSTGTLPPSRGQAAPMTGGYAEEPRRRSSRTVLLIVAGLLIAAGGATAVVLLDPFGRGAGQPAQLGPPGADVVSEPAVIEVFDDGRFVGETPLRLEVPPGKTTHPLQLVAGDVTFRIEVPAHDRPVSIFVRLPPERGELGHLFVDGPAGATATLEGQIVGKLPLTVIAADGASLTVQVDVDGKATEATGTATRAGEKVTVGGS